MASFLSSSGRWIVLDRRLQKRKDGKSLKRTLATPTRLILYIKVTANLDCSSQTEEWQLMSQEVRVICLYKWQRTTAYLIKNPYHYLVVRRIIYNGTLLIMLSIMQFIMNYYKLISTINNNSSWTYIYILNINIGYPK